jgi:hypothetical protein
MKLTQKQKIERYDELARERDTWQQLAYFLVNHNGPYGFDYEAREVVKADDGDELEFRLYATDRANGGTLAILTHTKGVPHASLDVAVFDDWLLAGKALPYGSDERNAIKLAAERLEVKRRRLYAAKEAKRDA